MLISHKILYLYCSIVILLTCLTLYLKINSKTIISVINNKITFFLFFFRFIIFATDCIIFHIIYHSQLQIYQKFTCNPSTVVCMHDYVWHMFTYTIMQIHIVCHTSLVYRMLSNNLSIWHTSFMIKHHMHLLIF